MKRFPAALALATVFLLTSPAVLRADESAEQLAEQQGLGGGDASDDSASDLAKKRGLGGGNAGKDDETSAADLAKEQGLGENSSDDESAAALAGEEGLEQKAGKDDEASAAELAEKEGLEEKPKVVVSSPAGSTYAPGMGVNGTVYAVAAQKDGKVVIGGDFNNVDGQPRANLARINADGSLDMTFVSDIENAVEGTVYALAIDPSGDVLVGGYFSQPKNSELKNFIRYTTEGAIDPKFSPNDCPNGAVYAIAVDSDGSVVIGGEFSEVGASPRRNLAKFKPDGSLAGPMNVPQGVSGTIRALVSHPTGSTFAGGEFEAGGNAARNVINVPAN